MLRSVYLTFEVNADCNLARLHPLCPVSDPERFAFGRTDAVLDDATILRFWRWACGQGFDGIILWHLYNEPTRALPRIRGLQAAMTAEVADQRFDLWTNAAAATRLEGFHHVEHTNYAIVRPTDLDNRRASTRGEGRPYAGMPAAGACGRGVGWEIILDYYGNWLLCCNDWRCEESVGNVLADPDWAGLLARYQARAVIAWTDAASYAALPRMCRSCLDVNPTLHRSAVRVS